MCLPLVFSSSKICGVYQACFNIIILLPVGGSNSGRRNYSYVQLPSARPASSKERTRLIHPSPSHGRNRDSGPTTLDDSVQKWKTTPVSNLASL